MWAHLIKGILANSAATLLLTLQAGFFPNRLDVGLRKPARQRVISNQQFFCAQPLDLISKLRGFFKFELFRHLDHFFLKISDHGFKIMPNGCRLVVYVTGLCQHMITLINTVENITNVFNDGLRGYPVGFVVFNLLFPPPFSLIHGALH